MLCSKVLEQFLKLKKTDLKKTAMIKEIFQILNFEIYLLHEKYFNSPFIKNENKKKQNKKNKTKNDKKWVIDNDDDHELLL